MRDNYKKIKKKYSNMYHEIDSNENILKKLKKRNLKKEKKIRICNIILCSGLLFLFFYLFLPYSKINEIIIENNEIIPSVDILNNLNIKKNKDFALFKYNFLIKQRLQSNKFIKHVNIKKNLSGYININIEEKKIIFKTLLDNKWVAFFSDGTFDEIPLNYNIHTILLDNINNYANFPYKQLALNLSLVPEEIFLHISDIKFSPTSISPLRFNLFMKDGNIVNILLDNIPNKLKYYFNLVEKINNERYEFTIEYNKKGILAKKI